jgi:hypothetical protein
MHHQQLAHQVSEGLAVGSPIRIADRPGEERVDMPFRSSGVIRAGSTILAPLIGFIWRRCRVVADDLDDLDGTEGDPQPPQSRELVIVDLGHATIMLPSWPEHRAAAWPGAARRDLYI